MPVIYKVKDASSGETYLFSGALRAIEYANDGSFHLPRDEKAAQQFIGSGRGEGSKYIAPALCNGCDQNLHVINFDYKDLCPQCADTRRSISFEALDTLAGIGWLDDDAAPGPWYFNGCEIRIPRGSIAYVRSSMPGFSRNGALLAAAPELLESVKNLLFLLDPTTEELADCWGDLTLHEQEDAHDAILRDARAIVAKASGREQEPE